MRDCWFEVPGARPSFSQLAEDIERILHIAAGTVRVSEFVMPMCYIFLKFLKC